VVFFGNLVGSLFFCGILVKCKDISNHASATAHQLVLLDSALVNSDPISNFITNGATTRVVTLEWHNLLCRGIGCNIMVCMSVYLASMASDLTGKVIGIWIPLMTFVVLQFEHVVADMFTVGLAT
jgi:formate/nitrite transporter FocA (FNT family)